MPLSGSRARSVRVWAAGILAVAALLLPALPLRATAASSPWTAQRSGTQQALYSISCFDAARCKAVGAGGTLLYTKDGGKTWRPQRNPLSGSAATLYRIACVGRSTCYVIARPNQILVTHNGGVSWSTHRIPLSGMNGQLVDSGCVSAQVFDLRGRPALCRLGLLDLACLNAATCYAVASVHVQAPLGSVAPTIVLTTDGGTTWTTRQIPAMAPCTGDCPPTARLPYPLEWITCGPGTVCRAGGSVFIGSHEGYASQVIMASKPGASWTVVPHNFSTAPDGAVCPTITRCYGVWSTSPFDLPGNGIFLSTNGGGIWNRLDGGSPRRRNAIACPGARTCYSVGNQGSITASINGGPFIAQRSGTSHDLYAVTCAGPTACYAVGNKGTIVGAGRRT